VVKEIPLQNGMVALVDDEDYERCMEYLWYANASNRSSVVVLNNKSILLGRFILNATNRQHVVTHKNNNRLDFRKENLVITSFLQALHKSKGRKNTSSKYKGVSWEKWSGKWRANIRNKGKTIFLGRYDNEDDAALAYNKAAIEIFGGHAYQNVIGKDNSVEEINVGKCLKPRKKNGMSSNYRGVCTINNSKSWVSQIKKDGKKYYIGSFQTEIEATRAYDKKAIELFGDKAILNLPEEKWMN